MNEEITYREEDYLRSLPVKGGFTVPDGYFEDQKSRLLFRLRQEGNAIQGLEVPEGYFEQSKARILKRTVEQPKKSLSLVNRPFFRYAIAASMILVSGISFNLLRDQQTTTQKTITSTDVLQYMEVNGATELSAAELINLLPASAVSTSAEENYLLEQSDNTLIFEEL
ncbi:MAG: hypothetical protein WC760_04645 [Bacteroidia bacterium]|jgi:hypothetical protein